MKILIMVHSLTGGGAERVAASWANGLVRRGHDVTVMTDLNQPVTYKTNREVRLINRDMFRMRKRTIFNRLKAVAVDPVKAFFQIYRYLVEEKPDAVVNVLYLNPYALLSARILSGYKVPVIMSDHNAYERPDGCGFKWKQWRNKFVDNRLFDRVTVLTYPDKTILIKSGIRHVDVLHNPLFFTPAANTHAKEKIVLAVGRINQWYYKGFDLLMTAWRDVVRQYPDWRLRMVGYSDSKTIEWLRQLAAESVNSIEFVPYTPDIIDEYRRASIFVLSSRYEGWGLVAVEAISQGCATVACDYKGRQAEYIRDNYNGILCSVDNADELSLKIRMMIADEPLRSKIQHNSIHSVGCFSESVVADKLERIILKTRHN